MRRRQTAKLSKKRYCRVKITDVEFYPDRCFSCLFYPLSIMSNHEELLSHDTRKALRLHLGVSASEELLGVLDRLSAEIKQLQKNKVSITPIVPYKGSLEETLIVTD